MTSARFAALATCLVTLVITVAPCEAQTHGPIRLPPDQSAAARRIALRLVDGDVSKQVFTADHAARLCYRAAVSNPSNAGGARDRDRLAPRQRAQLVECLADSGFRLRGS